MCVCVCVYSLWFQIPCKSVKTDQPQISVNKIISALIWIIELVEMKDLEIKQSDVRIDLEVFNSSGFVGSLD